MDAKPALLTIIDFITATLFMAAVILVFFYAPLEVVMGAVQKVFYFHVAAGWVGMLSFLIAAIAGIALLSTGRQKWDLVGSSCVEIGIVFIFINIVTGSIWARPIWNTWWTWDPRLTTATIMELIFATYLLLRQGIEEPERRARFSAVYTILGFVSVPLTFLSTRYLRSIHPIVIGINQLGSEGSFDMTPKMLQTFIFSLLTFTFIFADLLWHRIRLGRLAEEVERRKLITLENN